MRRFQFAALAAVAIFGFASVASAADLPVKAPVYKVAVAPYNWTGFYIGLDAGGFQSRTTLAVNGRTDCCTADMDPKGGVFGGHVGYRWQMPSNVVLGVEADAWGISGSTNVAANTDIPLGHQLRATSGGSLRLQAGYAMDRVLIYVTGGGSAINVKGCTVYMDVSTSACIEPTLFAGSSDFSGTPIGWTAGGGLDYAFWQNLTARVEYLYADYGAHTFSTLVFVPPSITTMSYYTTNVVRFGLSYKFGG